MWCGDQSLLHQNAEGQEAVFASIVYFVYESFAELEKCHTGRGVLQRTLEDIS